MNVINKIDEEIDEKMSEINVKIVNIKMKIDKETHAYRWKNGWDDRGGKKEYIHDIWRSICIG